VSSADVIVRSYLSRARLYAEATDPDGEVITVTGVDFAFTNQDTAVAEIEPADITWTAAELEAGTNGTTKVAAYMLVGPTADATAPVDLARGLWRWHTKWKFANGEEPVITLAYDNRGL
jgi:cob(I)alamin adenosyltransferase